MNVYNLGAFRQYGKQTMVNALWYSFCAERRISTPHSARKFLSSFTLSRRTTVHESIAYLLADVIHSGRIAAHEDRAAVR